jgi:hypothetical protein
MALQKEIILENGITVKYHRITSLNKITNNTTIIEVSSYTSKEKRQEEVNYYNNTEENKSMNVYIDTNYINVDYDESKQIEDYYEYLKTIDPYKGAVDC